MYDYTIDNLIERYAGELPDDFFFRNRGQAHLEGLELEAQVDLPEGFAVAVAGQIERGETVDDDAPLDDIPPESLNSSSARRSGRRSSRRAASSTRTTTIRAPTSAPGRATACSTSGPDTDSPSTSSSRPTSATCSTRLYLITPDARATLAPGISATFTGFVRF